MFSKTPVASLAGMAGVGSVLGWLVGAGVAVLAVVGVAGPAQAGTTDFVSTWKTDNTSSGSSAANQVRLPLESAGTYDFAVDWESDGTVDQTITAWDQATHTYAAGRAPTRSRSVSPTSSAHWRAGGSPTAVTG